MPANDNDKKLRDILVQLADLTAQNERLRVENRKLKLELEKLKQPEDTSPPPFESATAFDKAPATAATSLSKLEKVALFHNLFRGREDVYPVRWDTGPKHFNSTSGDCIASTPERPRCRCTITLTLAYPRYYRMFKRRSRGYRALGYEIGPSRGVDISSS